MKVESNFHKSVGWVVGAVTHAAESDDKFLSSLVDDLRYIYQLMAKDLKEMGIKFDNEAWCIYKHLVASMMNDVETVCKRTREKRPTSNLKKIISLKGELIAKLIDEFLEKKS